MPDPAQWALQGCADDWPSQTTIYFKYSKGDRAELKADRADNVLRRGVPRPSRTFQAEPTSAARQWIEQHGWEVVFLTERQHVFLQALQDSYSGAHAAGSDEARFLRCCVLHVRSALAARSRTDALNPCFQPHSLVLRQRASHSWTWLTWRHFWRRCVPADDANIMWERELDILDFQAVGRCLGAAYDGARYAAFGEKQCLCASMLPCLISRQVLLCKIAYAIGACLCLPVIRTSSLRHSPPSSGR